MGVDPFFKLNFTAMDHFRLLAKSRKGNKTLYAAKHDINYAQFHISLFIFASGFIKIPYCRNQKVSANCSEPVLYNLVVIITSVEACILIEDIPGGQSKCKVIISQDLLF